MWKKVDLKDLDFFDKWQGNVDAQSFLNFLQFDSGVIFLTWKAWTWKSTLIHDVISYYESKWEYPLVFWSTWVSALNIWWQTVHSFFALWIDDPYFKEIQYYIKDKTTKKFKLKSSKIKQMIKAPFLIIDEISMLSSNILDSIDFLMRFYLALYTKNTDLTKIPFWWKKMIFVWDVYQLPPVKNEKWIEKFDDVYKSERFFDSNVFSKLVKKDLWHVISLKQNYRQNGDKVFAEILDKIRQWDLSSHQLELLNSKISHSNSDDEILLSTHRHKVDSENQGKLSELSWNLYSFTSESDGIFPDYMKRADDILSLKIWAKVMLLTNEPSWYRVNGSIWEVAWFDEEVIYVKIKWRIYPISQYTWENIETVIDDDGKVFENVLGTFTQFPLKLAYAITVHKSQWMTFDNCRLDISRVFAGWQAYTALSRARSLSGISLSWKINQKHLFFDGRIKEFVDKYMRDY